MSEVTQILHAIAGGNPSAGPHPDRSHDSSATVLRSRPELFPPRLAGELVELCRRLDVADVQFSVGVVGAGMALYEAAIAQGHEGVMAKHLASTYRPGRRSAAWRNIKPRP